MGLADTILYQIAKRWPSPMKRFDTEFGAQPGTAEYDRAYAISQFNRQVCDGIGLPVFGKDVLEIGSGHGSISCFAACAGARSVVGIDINQHSMQFGRELAEKLGTGLSGRLPVTFQEMDAYNLSFGAETFDIVISENSFEHFIRPERVMEESFRVLRPGGALLVPIFSSIYSMYGLHLKNGLKLPWANLFFSEKTIIKAMQRLAIDKPALLDTYPGLRNGAQRVRDLRAHGDLNDITYGKFKQMARDTGFKIERFRPISLRIGYALRLLGPLQRTLLADILSGGASACLRKPKRPAVSPASS